MIVQNFLKICIIIVIFSQTCVLGKGTAFEEEYADDPIILDFELRYLLKRLNRIQENSSPVFNTKLGRLQKKVLHAEASKDVHTKIKILENFYENPRHVEFETFLRNKMDDQELNLEIRKVIWYWEQAMPHLTDCLAGEVMRLLFKLGKALATENLIDKYQMFSDTIKGATTDLRNIWFLQPELTLDARSKLNEEYLSYLLLHSYDSTYRKEIKLLLEAVQSVINTDEIEDKKQVLELCDDNTTRFGRFLQIIREEFLFDKFIV